MSSKSAKCAKCIAHTSYKYDLIIFKVKWAQVYKDRLYLYSEVQIVISEV